MVTVNWPALGALHCLTALKTISNHDPQPEDLAQEGRKGGWAGRSKAPALPEGHRLSHVSRETGKQC